jgi:spore germination protein YaaH
MKKIFASVMLVTLGLLFFLGILLHLTTPSPQLFSQPENSVLLPSSLKPLASPIVYGYLPYWTRTKAVFHPQLTAVSYFSLGIQADGSLLDLPKNKQESGYKAYQNGVLSNLRTEIRADQKLELTISMMDQETIPLFVSDKSAHTRFLDDLETIITSAQIDGINIDIEYNGLVDETLQANLTELLQKTKTLLKSQPTPLSLSIATYGDAGNLKRITNLQTIAPHVDHIIMMAYDYHRASSPNAGPNAPLYGKTKRNWASDIMHDLKEYTDVVPAKKILLGIPFYGYQWQIEDGSDPNSFTIPKTGASVMYTYIPNILALPGAQEFWDAEAFSPYVLFSKGSRHFVLYYDDSRSLSYKLQLVRQADLGGIAIWASGYEGETTDLWKTIEQDL